MNALLLAVGLLVAPATSPADTVVELRRGDRIVVENLSGDLFLVAWDRPELRVPPWAEVVIRGRELDVVVWGVEASVSVQNVEGDIHVEGPASAVDASSVQDEVRVRGARGPVRAHSQGDDVTVEDVVGNVDAESGDGDVSLWDVDGMEVRGGDPGRRRLLPRIHPLRRDVPLFHPRR